MPAERVEQQELGEIVAMRAQAKLILDNADAKAKSAASRINRYGYEGGMYSASLNAAGALMIRRVDGTPI